MAIAVTLRLDAEDEALLREVAERTNHTMTDKIGRASCRERVL